MDAVQSCDRVDTPGDRVCDNNELLNRNLDHTKSRAFNLKGDTKMFLLLSKIVFTCRTLAAILLTSALSVQKQLYMIDSTKGFIVIVS